MDVTPRAPSYPTGPSPGGSLPEIGKLVSDTFAEFGDHLAPYLLGGLGQTLVLFPVTIVFLFLTYAGIGVSMVGSMLLSAVAVSVVPEEAQGVAFALGQLVSLGATFVLLTAMIVGITLVLAPISASLMRAVADQQKGGDGQLLQLSSPFASLPRNVRRVIGVSLAQVAVSVVLAAFCFFPVLLVPVFLAFTTPMVALHDDLTVREVLATNVRHAREHLGWHVSFAIVSMLLGLAAAYVPVAGPAFVTAFYVRAHRELFGDGPLPVLDEVRV